MAADYDGRYLVYSLLHSTTTFDDWSLHLWDSAGTAPAREIARSPRGGDSVPLPGPLNNPLVHQGRVVWVQAQPLGEGTALHAYDISSGRRTTLRDGHPGIPVRMGSWLLWPESDAPGALVRLRGMDFATGTALRLPAALQDVRGATSLAASDDVLAWAAPDLRTLWVWRRNQPRPVAVATEAAGATVQAIHIAGDVVTYDSGSAQWAVDLRSGARTQLTPQFGAQHTGGTYLKVQYAPGTENEHHSGLGDETIVNLKTLAPLPACER